MASLKLKPGFRPRVLHGHPWVFANELQKLLPPEHDGQSVECRDSRGRFLGSGIYNSRSMIAWRRYSPDKLAFDAAYLRNALSKALDLRKGKELCRLVWSESDDLPGLIVDRYGPVLVMQALTLAVDRNRDSILDYLQERLEPSCIILRNDAPSREKEGLPRQVEIARGSQPEPIWLNHGGLEFLYDSEGGQKTGWYLDQLEQHLRVATYARGRRVLDVFCNQGGFALHCAKAGASSVTAVDVSDDAIALGKGNAEKNGLNVDWICANAFDFLSRQGPGSSDLIILDPPPFAKSKDRLEEAARGYKEINLRAMKQLSPGGILATYTCSHHVSHDMLRELLASAAADAGRKLRVREVCMQSPDHPVILTIPESEYLRGMILEIA